MEKSETMRLIGQQSLDLDIETKNRIFDVASDYSNKTGITLSDLLVFGTDIYVLTTIMLQMNK